MTASTTGKPTLGDVLRDFQTKFNGNSRAQKIATGWNRLVLLEARDTGVKYGLVVDNSRLADVCTMESVDDDADNLVHLQADESILVEIFSGQYNPATALTDGNLAVFSPDRDKVKLEALAMVIWRLG
jgi:hypothetical protein